jgi:hypothetical protein
MGMNSTALEPLDIEGEQLALLLELLESAHARMLVGIRHTDHRIFRDELRHRLTLVEQIIERCPHVPMPAPAP